MLATRRIKIICFSLILSYSGILLGADGDEDLRNQARQIFGPLPQEMASEKNPVTPEKAALGKMLFYETRISWTERQAALDATPSVSMAQTD